MTIYSTVALFMGAFLILIRPDSVVGYALVVGSAAFMFYRERRQREPTRGGYVYPPSRPSVLTGTYRRVIDDGGWLWHEYENGERVLIGPAPDKDLANGDVN